MDHPKTSLRRTFSVLFLLIASLCVVSASSGDRDSLFLTCVQKCRRTYCNGDGDATSTLPIVLRLTGWTCGQDCNYKCTHEVTDINIKSGGRVQQFYGKWPFTRVLGLQEPASVLFSILNGYVHYRGYRSLRSIIPRWYPLRTPFLFNSLLNINAWIWSTVFHARDFPATEKLDYFSAMAAILFGAVVAVARVFGFQYRSRLEKFALVAIPTLFYACHVTYLSLGSFDYGYNMIAGVVVGVSSNIVWMYWALRNWRIRPYAWKVAFLVIAISAAMALELFDFPPWKWILDAHSLWHAATIPLVALFYSFVMDDIRTEIKAGKGKQSLD